MSESMDGGKRSHWEALLRQFRSSGLTVREFCRRRGVSEPSFYTWRRRLGGRGERAAPLAPLAPLFVPVRVAAPPAADASAGEGPGWIELRLGGGVTVRVFGEVPAARLAAVLGALGEGGGGSC